MPCAPVQQYRYEDYIKKHENSFDSSEITESLERNCTWIQDEDRETKLSFQAFFRYINFAVTYESIASDLEQEEPISEEVVRELVKSRRTIRAQKDHVLENQMLENYTVSVISASQVTNTEDLTKNN